MHFFSKLSLKYKILSIALIGAVGFVSYLGYSFSSTQNNTARLESIERINFPVLDNTGRIWLLLFEARTLMQTAISDGEIDLIKDAEQNQQEINQLLDKIEQLNPAYKIDALALKNELEQYISSARTLTQGMIKGTISLSAMSSMATNMHGYYKQFTKSLKEFRVKALSDFSERLLNAKQESRQTLNTGLVIGISIIVLLLLVAWVISRQVTSNIYRIVKELEEMSTGNGDLTVRLETNAKDEIGLLVDRFNGFVTHLQLMIKVLANLSHGVTNGASEVYKIAQHTRTGIENQQHEIQQVATAISEMAQTAIEVSSNAAQAATATTQGQQESHSSQVIVQENIKAITCLAEDIENARNVIQTLSDQVQTISASSQDIRSIADQTNLLALNAAIEAARAGEQGRGFAVVADEVRTLAGRTSESTNQIEEIIGQLLVGTQKAVELMEKSKIQAYQSVTQSESTGKSLQQILNSIDTISNMNQMVALSADEQRSVAEDVSKNIVRIDDFSEQTVEDAKATAESTESLSAQAEQLKSIVNEFKV
ncbi:MAG: methyl-accepting chemotaxis protein [Psychrobacter glaciei]|jgi:methyl-accepting chemotaxis protein